MENFESIIPGREYFLDGKTRVKVIRQINRSGTSFSVETLDGSILIVEKNRLRTPGKETARIR